MRARKLASTAGSQLKNGAVVLCQNTLASLRELDKDGRVFVQDLGGLYLATAPELLAKLGAAFLDGNLKLAKRIAHQLHSCSENIGAIRLAECCALLETYQGSALCEEAAAIVETIRAEYEAAKAALSHELAL